MLNIRGWTDIVDSFSELASFAYDYGVEPVFQMVMVFILLVILLISIPIIIKLLLLLYPIYKFFRSIFKIGTTTIKKIF